MPTCASTATALSENTCQSAKANRRDVRASVSRRAVVLQSVAAPALVQLMIGSDDPTTIINSVLSGYGLPTLKASSGYKAFDEFEDDFTFEYPRSWVARPNSLRQGIYISDFQVKDVARLIHTLRDQGCHSYCRAAVLCYRHAMVVTTGDL